MPIFSQKNVHSLKNTVLLCRFFQIFHENPAAAMPIFGPKKVNSFKTIWAKKVNRMPFFPISHEKITALMPIFCQQNANSLKTHFSHVHIFSKNINSLKHAVVSYHFFQICYEKPLAVVPIVGQKNRQFCQNYTILWAKKVNRMPFPPYFSRKNNFSHAHFL